MPEQSQFVWYFAYGSNMCRGKMLRTIGGHWQQEETATAKGFEVVFNKDSAKWGAAANIAAAPRKRCKGVIYKITETQFKKLRKSEKGYETMCIEVQTERGNTIVARTFVALPGSITVRRLPKQQYLDFIWQGGIEHNLPRRYLSDLMGKGKKPVRAS